VMGVARATAVEIEGDAEMAMLCNEVYVEASVLYLSSADAKRLVSAATEIPTIGLGVPRSNFSQHGGAESQCHVVLMSSSMALCGQLRGSPWSPEHTAEAAQEGSDELLDASVTHVWSKIHSAEGGMGGGETAESPRPFGRSVCSSLRLARPDAGAEGSPSLVSCEELPGLYVPALGGEARGVAPAR